MPVPYQYPETSWSRRKLRTRGDVELAADIQRRAQSGVRGWSDETLESNQLSKDWRNSHEQQRRRNFTS
jgi:hypothetical protein